jgi:hypothetical protein
MIPRYHGFRSSFPVCFFVLRDIKKSFISEREGRESLPAVDVRPSFSEQEMKHILSSLGTSFFEQDVIRFRKRNKTGFLVTWEGILGTSCHSSFLTQKRNFSVLLTANHTFLTRKINKKSLSSEQDTKQFHSSRGRQAFFSDQEMKQILSSLDRPSLYTDQEMKREVVHF